MSKKIPYIHWRTIPFGDTDAAAIVYTPRFSDYCMEAAEVWFRDAIDYDWYEVSTKRSMGCPVVQMEIRFVAPLKGGDKLGVTIDVLKVSRSTVTLKLEGRRLDNDTEEITSFIGNFIFCFTNEQGSIAIPETQKTHIENYIKNCQRQ
jgi:4-hydroxybenzoyl-CoA thioesterase